MVPPALRAWHAPRFGLRVLLSVLLSRVIGAMSGQLLRIPAVAWCPLPFVHGMRHGVVCEIYALPLLGICVGELLLAVAPACLSALYPRLVVSRSPLWLPRSPLAATLGVPDLLFRLTLVGLRLALP